MGGLNAFILQHLLRHVKVQVVSRIIAVDEKDAPASMDSPAHFHDGSRVRGSKHITTGSRVSQSPSHKTGKHGIVAASATNHQPNLAFPVIFIEYTVYITNLLIVTVISCNKPLHHLRHHIIRLVDNFLGH